VGHRTSTVVDPQAHDLERDLDLAALRGTTIRQVIDSTVGFEKRFNPALALASPEAFVAALTAEVPPKPAGMAALLRQNQGRA
jgi:hypothetical protein